MDDSLGYFKSLLETDSVLDDTLSFDYPHASQVPSNLQTLPRADPNSLSEFSQGAKYAELDSAIQQGDDEIENSSDSSEDLAEQEFSDSDNDVNKGIEAGHDGGSASIASVVHVDKREEVDGEFVNNPMTFNVDKSWLETYNVADLTNERQFAMHDPTNANGDWKGLIFSDKKVLKRALEEWHVIHFVRMEVKKSDTYRYTCVCVQSNCRWRLHAYKPKGAAYFLVSQYKGSHNCVISVGHSMHRNCTSALICEKILPSLRASSSMSVKDIRMKIKDDWKTYVSYELAWKARSRALRTIYGSWEQSFSDLPKYFSMMQASNPGTIWTMNPCTGSNGQQFKRAFWAFGPSIEGWKNCRPVVSIDGTHLYGKYEGNALIATSIDANRGLYPIAFAVCDRENGDNWEWFLRSLKEFVTCERKVCIISDRFSGNKEVVRRVFSPDDGHAHRWCLRHIKANLKKAGFIDKVVLDKFYSIGCATEVVDFNRLKEQLKTECRDAWQWVEEKLNDDREYWALAFDGGRRYGVMTTNWSESLNSVLRGTRSLPIMAFVAATFYRINQTFVDRSEKGSKMTTQLCPKALDKIRPRQLAARGYHVGRFGPCEYEVNNGTSTYSIMINGKLSECVCQAFRLTGLPCSHMLACCGDQWHGTDFHTLCDNWYFTEMYRNAYSIQFHSVPDKRFWPSYEGPIVLPPALRKKKGRPKSTRIHNSMDWRETPGTSKRKCSHCSELGHYKKKCPQLCKSSNPTRRKRGATTRGASVTVDVTT